jgi:hypothetical protein
MSTLASAVPFRLAGNALSWVRKAARIPTSMLEYGPAERVYVENDWYDGPRAGIADINGHPHRFKSLFDKAEDESLGTFLVWPVDREQLGLEIEQWQIFAEWNALCESGRTGVESHPGHGGRNARWDRIEALLQPGRSHVPPEAHRAVARLEHIDRPSPYDASGPAYMMRWRILAPDPGST